MSSPRHICALIAITTLLAAPRALCQDKDVPVAVTSAKTYTWDKGAEGWMGTNDFRLSSSFTKLGGPYRGGSSWVTECPTDHSKYTEGAYASSQGYSETYPGPNLLLSPWFDLSPMVDTALFISFRQSLALEPGWDGSWMEYSTGGTLWKHLGRLDDPDGVNWYSTGTYRNANSQAASAADTVTLLMPRYRLYGAGSAHPAGPFAWWTSDGDPAGAGKVEGPFGWILCQLKITPSRYPDIVHSHRVRFRYVAFSDAATASEGWAVDDFTIGITPVSAK